MEVQVLWTLYIQYYKCLVELCNIRNFQSIYTHIGIYLILLKMWSDIITITTSPKIKKIKWCTCFSNSTARTTYSVKFPWNWLQPSNVAEQPCARTMAHWGGKEGYSPRTQRVTLEQQIRICGGVFLSMKLCITHTSWCECWLLKSRVFSPSSKLTHS